jgi:hypothetical protein
MPSPDRNFANAAIFTQTASGTTPNSGDTSLYIKSDNDLYVKDSGGVEAKVAPVKSVAGKTGAVTIALGDITQSGATTNQVATWNGTAWVPQTPSGGGGGGGGISAVGATLDDILSVSGADLVADDLGADRIYGWDDSAGKAIGFSLGAGLETDGTAIKSKLVSDPTGITGADAITNLMSLTQAEYNAIASPNASTLYIITDP